MSTSPSLRGIVLIDASRLVRIFATPGMPKDVADGVTSVVASDVVLQQDYVLTPAPAALRALMPSCAASAVVAAGDGANQARDGPGEAPSVRFKPRARSMTVASTAHLTKAAAYDDPGGKRPPHELLPSDGLSDQQINATPVLHTGALLCRSDDHPWVQRHERERVERLHAEIAALQDAGAESVVTGSATAMPRPCSGGASSEPTSGTQAGEGSSSAMESGKDPLSQHVASLRADRDAMLLLWRLLDGVVIVFCCDAASINVPLARHCMSVLIQLLPLAFAHFPGWKPEAGHLPRAAVLAKAPDVVAQTCEVVAPNGQHLLFIDVTVAKAALAARFPK